MKKGIPNLLAVLILVISGNQLYSQCTPDPSCTDVDEPGQLCPNTLADGVINVAYNEVITVIPPKEATIQGNVIPISYIVIDSILQIPAGMNYSPSADKFWADSLYCIGIHGTPTELGEFKLAVYVTPWVYFNGTYIPGPQVKDDSSVVMKVVEVTDIEHAFIKEFEVGEAYPNPFSEQTNVQFSTPVGGRFELEVYNLLGVRIHYQEQVVYPGRYSFYFDGHALKPGTYIYTVSNRERMVKGRLIKK